MTQAEVTINLSYSQQLALYSISNIYEQNKKNRERHGLKNALFLVEEF